MLLLFAGIGAKKLAPSAVSFPVFHGGLFDQTLSSGKKSFKSHPSKENNNLGSLRHVNNKLDDFMQQQRISGQKDAKNSKGWAQY